jgi:hypothetical protein
MMAANLAASPGSMGPVARIHEWFALLSTESSIDKAGQAVRTTYTAITNNSALRRLATLHEKFLHILEIHCKELGAAFTDKPGHWYSGDQIIAVPTPNWLRAKYQQQVTLERARRECGSYWPKMQEPKAR